MDCCLPDPSILHYLPEFAQIHVHWVSDAIQPSHLLPPHPFAFNLSQHQGLFQWVTSSHWVPKYWSFSFSISSSSEYSVLISFRMDRFDFLAVQGTLKSLLSYHSSKTSILWYSAFVMLQLSHLHMTTGKTIALTVTLLAKWCLCFLICYLDFHSFPSKEQESFNFMTAVTICSDFGAQENKSCNCFHFFPFYLLWSNGLPSMGSHSRTRLKWLSSSSSSSGTDLSFLYVVFQASFFTLLFHPYQETL